MGWGEQIARVGPVGPVARNQPLGGGVGRWQVPGGPTPRFVGGGGYWVPRLVGAWVETPEPDVGGQNLGRWRWPYPDPVRFPVQTHILRRQATSRQNPGQGHLARCPVLGDTRPVGLPRGRFPVDASNYGIAC